MTTGQIVVLNGVPRSGKTSIARAIQETFDGVWLNIGVDVIVDVDHHEWYSMPLGILPRCARILEGLPVLFVGVHCPVDAIRQRRIETWNQSPDDADFGAPVDRFQSAVHDHGGYDVEVDTSVLSPEACAEAIAERLRAGPGSRFAGLAGR